MTEKEKAKAYDGAIERAKKSYGNIIAGEIFPELKKDDAERIKKNCIHFLELQKQHHAATFEIEECIDWIKKQSKNSTDKIEPKFKVSESFLLFGYFLKINQFYLLESVEGDKSCPTIDWVDDTFHLWTIQDAKNGDIICYRDEISLYKNEIKNCNKQDTTFGGFVYYCCYDGKRFITNSFYLLIGQDEIGIYPATKEQRDSLMKVMNDAGYEWDAEKKELKKKKK